MFKLILLALAGYLVYTYFVKPKALNVGPSSKDEGDDEQYVEYEDVTDE